MLTAARNLPVKLEDVLLGNVLGVSQGEMLVTLGLAAAVLLVVYFLHKEPVFTNFDPIGASVIGVPTEKLEYVLLCLLAVVVVLALPAVGIVLVISMLITPAAAASLLVRNFPAAIAVGAMIGVASAIAGLYISFHFNLPSGPLMALVATGFFVLAVVYRGRLPDGCAAGLPDGPAAVWQVPALGRRAGETPALRGRRQAPRFHGCRF